MGIGPGLKRLSYTRPRLLVHFTGTPLCMLFVESRLIVDAFDE